MLTAVRAGQRARDGPAGGPDRKGLRVIRIAKMGAWSVRYYESTAVRGHEHGGGLSEYYSERDTRAPIVLVAGDREFAEEKMGVTHHGEISQAQVTDWFENAVSPAGPGVGKPRPGTCGWDVLFTVPKSVSLLAALSEDPAVGTIITNAIREATEDALEYMHRHAGYTRVSNPTDASKKDLQRLPALPFVAYFHHTARPTADGTCDPHMHIHALLPGKIARADGRMVTIDSQSMYHEARAGGMIFQKSMRDRMSAGLGCNWDVIDPHTGIAEIAGFTREEIEKWSRRSSEVMEWAEDNLSEYSRLHRDDDARADGEEPSRRWAKGQREFLDVAQKATRHKKLEALPYDELRDGWRNDPRAAGFDAYAYVGQVDDNSAAKEQPQPPTAAQVFELLGREKNTWTRADVVEAVVALWEPPAPGEPPLVTVDEVEATVDDILRSVDSFQVAEDRQSWHREGHVRYTDMATLKREAEVLKMCSLKSREFVVNVREEWFIAKGLRPGAAKAMTELAQSSRFINVLEAPAGSGKTTSLKAFTERAEAQHKRVVLLTTARIALREARQKGAASEYYTIASTQKRIAEDRIDWDHKTIVVVDEAAMTGDRELHQIYQTALNTHSKVILVTDTRQLQPVASSGGMVRDLSENLPWTQSFDYVWRQKDPVEKSMTLLMREAQTESEIRKVSHWYAQNDRLRAGDALTMADQVVRDYFDQIVEGRDVLVIADKWELVNSLNLRIQRINTLALENQLGHELAAVPIDEKQTARYGDIIMTRENDYDYGIVVTPDSTVTTIDHHSEPEKVNRGDRWRVLAVDEHDGSIEAMRISDHARAVLPADYAQKHVRLGYVATMHSSQGATADVGFAIGDPDTMTKTMLYPAMTRGVEMNRLYMATKIAGEDDHHREHSDLPPERRVHDANEAQVMMMAVMRRDDREQTALAQAEEALQALTRDEPHDNHREAFGGIHPYVAQLVHTRAGRREQWAHEYRQQQQDRDDYAAHVERVQQRIIDQSRQVDRDRDQSRERDYDDRDDGLEIGM